MEDGREVLLGPLHGVKKGDYLVVFTNIAIDKVSTKKG
jgi:hydrogenase maturation factor